MVRVGGTAPFAGTGYQNLPHYAYLNDAINYYLSKNYQRIIILEGDYYVNGSILIDYHNETKPSISSNYGSITIEGEGFGTRILNAGTYTTGNIFEVRSHFNTIKNLSIISNNKNTCLAITTDQSTV